MPFPTGLEFHNRLAEDANGFYFYCNRKSEHPKEHPRFRLSFDSKGDRDLYVTRHDAIYHDMLLAQQIGGEREDEPVLAEIIARYMKRLERRWREGDADLKTLDDYRKASRRLLRHLGAHTPASRITTQRIMKYDEDRRAESNSKGALIKKEIARLGTMYRDYGIAPTWVLGRNAIKAKKLVRKPIGEEKWVRFILAMEPGSLEWDFSVMKLATGMRNEELYAANAGDVDLEARELVYQLRNKQGELEQHVTYLNDIALEIASRRVVDRSPLAPLFVIGEEQRRLTYTSLRKRFAAASARATAAWRREDKHAPEIKITAIGQFRHEAATEVLERLGDVRVVQQQYGHRTQKTTETRYILPSRRQKVAASRKFTDATAAALEPLRRRK